MVSGMYCFYKDWLSNLKKITVLFQDRIDSISYSNRTSRFVTGSKDGFARIWRFDRQEWINTVLNTSKRLDR